MKTILTPWNQMGDHALVKENTCDDFEYTQAASKGCGFINTFTIVHPGSYIVDINGIYVGVINKEDAQKIYLVDHPVIIEKQSLTALSDILTSKISVWDDYSYNINMLKKLDAEVFQKVFIHHNSIFLNWFSKNSQDHYSFVVKVEKTIDLIFTNLNDTTVLDSEYYHKLFSTFNPFTEYLVNEISFDELYVIINKHKKFIDSYRNILLDSNIMKSLVDGNDLSSNTEDYINNAIDKGQFSPNYDLIANKWSKSFNIADFNYDITTIKYQLLKKMFAANILDMTKYSKTNKHSTFFESFVLSNQKYAFENADNFNKFLREIEALENMGMCKKVNFQKKDVFINCYVSKQKSAIDKLNSNIVFNDFSKNEEKPLTKQQIMARKWHALIEEIEFNNV